MNSWLSTLACIQQEFAELSLSHSPLKGVRSVRSLFCKDSFPFLGNAVRNAVPVHAQKYKVLIVL